MSESPYRENIHAACIKALDNEREMKETARAQCTVYQAEIADLKKQHSKQVFMKFLYAVALVAVFYGVVRGCQHIARYRAEGARARHNAEASAAVYFSTVARQNNLSIYCTYTTPCRNRDVYRYTCIGYAQDGRHVDACCDSDEAAGNEGCSPR